MAKGSQVLEMLLPNGGWTIIDNAFDSIIYDAGVTPVTQTEFEAGFTQYDTWKAEQNAQAAANKAALLARLGITAEEATLLLS